MLLLFREMCLTYYLVSLIWLFYCFYSVHIQIPTMCETMANIPIEDNTSYVLTEDMFDAAMTKEFSFQVSTKFQGKFKMQLDLQQMLKQRACSTHFIMNILTKQQQKSVAASARKEGNVSIPILSNPNPPQLLEQFYQILYQ